MLFVFKCFNGLAPPYLAELITIKENCNCELRSDGCLQESKTTNKFGNWAFLICGPVLWNRLSDCMKETNSLDKFKKELKTHLFTEAFGWSQICHYRLLLSFLCHIHVFCWYMNTFSSVFPPYFAKCYWILYRSWHLTNYYYYYYSSHAIYFSLC